MRRIGFGVGVGVGVVVGVGVGFPSKDVFFLGRENDLFT